MTIRIFKLGKNVKLVMYDPILLTQFVHTLKLPESIIMFPKTEKIDDTMIIGLRHLSKTSTLLSTSIRLTKPIPFFLEKQKRNKSYEMIRLSLKAHFDESYLYEYNFFPIYKKTQSINMSTLNHAVELSVGTRHPSFRVFFEMGKKKYDLMSIIDYAPPGKTIDGLQTNQISYSMNPINQFIPVESHELPQIDLIDLSEKTFQFKLRLPKKKFTFVPQKYFTPKNTLPKTVYTRRITNPIQFWSAQRYFLERYMEKLL